VNAIVTFGLDPRASWCCPVCWRQRWWYQLSVLAGAIGLFGGALVMLSFDIGFVQYQPAADAVHAADFVIGLVKALVFGLVIAGRLPAAA
jgi:phospholipid/cholesterol/gamma-HCH transport system permease protein